MAHPHEWVRLCAAQFLGKVMSVLSPNDISAILNDAQLERPGFLLNNTREKIRSLSLDFCGQLTPGAEIGDKLLMQVWLCSYCSFHYQILKFIFMILLMHINL